MSTIKHHSEYHVFCSFLQCSPSNIVQVDSLQVRGYFYHQFRENAFDKRDLTKPFSSKPVKVLPSYFVF